MLLRRILYHFLPRKEMAEKSMDLLHWRDPANLLRGLNMQFRIWGEGSLIAYILQIDFGQNPAYYREGRK